MTINKKQNGNELVLALSGRLDTTTVGELDALLANGLDGVSKLVFDFAGLDYISSAGLRSLLSAQKKMNSQGEMIIKNINEIVSEIFDITGFVDILTIE
ncbi:MAG: STAS domain-containing protein [Clostridia bacterium]|nr:STAS domain-containing protein [Clostridia bacterium]MBQ4244749.1 STAS domain-containing protein [Clostridia bacterium]